MVERGAKLVAGTQKERHEGGNLRARRKTKFGSREKGKGRERRWRNASSGNRGLVEPKEKKSRCARRRRRITPARLHAGKGYTRRRYATARRSRVEEYRGGYTKGDERGTLVVGIKEGWRRREFTERDERRRGKK